MDSKETRSLFIDFFKSKEHSLVKSSSLLPHNDQSLLFTNAGMVQFKKIFLSQEERPYKRAVTSQKCIRVGGKHNDLESVGHTARHHTFFEMLGNFSFGDYFKKEAILFAWQLLTECYKLPKDKLWVSVYEQDNDSYFIWQNLTDIQPQKIVRLGAEDNFWQMAETGPCGPCSEIIIDQGRDVGCGKPDCRVGCDCDRFLELWNLVFMQSNKNEQGTLILLSKPSIDTGMGLERISAVLQKKTNNFDTDLFLPIISDIESLSGIQYRKYQDKDISIKVIADHIRAISFLLAEGLMPSNEKRGYVLRRIIRRASRHARLLGLSSPVLHKFISPVINIMGDIYPEIYKEKDRIKKILSLEEERFSRTLEQGVSILDDIMDKLKSQGEKIIPGIELFRLYDTFGFPLDLARDIARDSGLKIDEIGFQREMDLQKQRTRVSWIKDEVAIHPIYKDILASIRETEFVGYDKLETSALVRYIIKDNKPIVTASQSDEVQIFLNKTAFYAESGGQCGDKGMMFNDNCVIEVLDTQKKSGLYCHLARIKEGVLLIGDTVTCNVDEKLRTAISRSHTATHLLQAALKNILGEDIKQSGSSILQDKLRFDFSHFYQVNKSELEKIEDFMQEKIYSNIKVFTEIMDIEDAISRGAIALFGEKYEDKVRVVKIETISQELCGGTHSKSTGDIGLFVINSESSVTSGIRRIEALTGELAFNYLRDRRNELKLISETLKTNKPIERIEKMLLDIKDKEKEMETLKIKLSLQKISSIIEQTRMIKGTKVLSYRIDNLEQKELRELSDNIKDKLGSSIIILISVKDNQASIIATVTKDLTSRFNAGNILKKIVNKAGGKGGGKADMAQGAVKDIEKLDEVMKTVYLMVEKIES